MGKATTKIYTIYKLSNGKDVYVGMTTQSLEARLKQHKRDASLETCSVTAKLCQKKLPSDLKALHRRLRDHPEKFRVSKLSEVSGNYYQAHKEEMSMKKKHATLK